MNKLDVSSQYLCEKCGDTLGDKSNLQEHMMNCNNTNLDEVRTQSLKCDHCEETFHSKEELNKHSCQTVKNVHGEYVCNKCSLNVISLEDLNRHREQCHAENEILSNFKCEFCQNDFGSVEEMDQHKESCHKTNLILRSFKCNECNKSLRNEVDLENHKKSKHEASVQKTKQNILARNAIKCLNP